MNRTGFYGSSLFFGLLLQLIVGRYLTFFGVGPDFLFIYVVAVSFSMGPLTGEALGFLLGLMTDVLGARLFGMQSFLFTLAGYTAGVLRRRVDSERPGSQCLIAFVATLLYGLVSALLKGILAQAGPRTPLLGLLIEAVANALFAPFIFWGTLWWTHVWQLHHE